MIDSFTRIMSFGEDYEPALALNYAGMSSTSLFDWSLLSLPSLLKVLTNNLDIWSNPETTIGRFQINKAQLNAFDWQKLNETLKQYKPVDRVLTGLVDRRYNSIFPGNSALFYGEVLSVGDLLTIEPNVIYKINLNEASYLREETREAFHQPGLILIIRKEPYIDQGKLSLVHDLATVLNYRIGHLGCKILLAIPYIESIDSSRFCVGQVEVTFHQFSQFSQVQPIKEMDNHFSQWNNFFSAIGLSPITDLNKKSLAHIKSARLERAISLFPGKQELKALLDKSQPISWAFV